SSLSLLLRLLRPLFPLPSLLLLCGAPPSPLFPYTTLFRSLQVLPHRAVRRFKHTVELQGGFRHGPRFGQVDLPVRQLDLQVLHLDRKSTRLNSSHVSISYAVFCLKKKRTRRPCDRDSASVR